MHLIEDLQWRGMIQDIMPGTKELLEKEMNMKDKGPNDLEWIINKLNQRNYKLEMEIEMLKRDIAFLQEELQAERLKNERRENDIIKL
jgi:polyhydroxyalkanoate synthesis regulator phasin